MSRLAFALERIANLGFVADYPGINDACPAQWRTIKQKVDVVHLSPKEIGEKLLRHNAGGGKRCSEVNPRLAFTVYEASFRMFPSHVVSRAKLATLHHQPSDVHLWEFPGDWEERSLSLRRLIEIQFCSAKPRGFLKTI